MTRHTCRHSAQRPAITRSIGHSDIGGYRGCGKSAVGTLPLQPNKYLNVFRKTLKIAMEEGIIANLPPIAMVPRQDNPRPFFRFEPLTTPENDQMAKLITEAEAMAQECGGAASSCDIGTSGFHSIHVGIVLAANDRRGVFAAAPPCHLAKEILGELKRPNTTLNPRDLRPTIKVVQPKAKNDC